jgi:predicted metal-dependent enzyme (double-stranded beta helix superfamily)
MANAARFRDFVRDFTTLIEPAAQNEERILDHGSKLLSQLVSHDDWLPEECAKPHPDYYQQYLLHCDPLERFSVVSFVWGPGQTTPVHDHTVWGLVGVMRGAELCRRYSPEGGRLTAAEQQKLMSGEVDRLSPAAGDIHDVANAFNDRVSISIHVYGANIGAVKRHVYDTSTGDGKPFVSGYSSALMPNFWDRSAEVRATLQCA